MRILLDCSPAKILEYRQRYAHDFGQLRTPLTNYALAPAPVDWAADNGFFKTPDVAGWMRWMGRFNENRERRPIFVTLPDVVGDAARTLELFEWFRQETNELPRALVIQDGIEHCTIPWRALTAVFIGGSTTFKYSDQALNVARVARMLGKHVHVGRVNTDQRLRYWLELGDTIDGSGISQFDGMLEPLLDTLAGTHPQELLRL